MTRRGNLMFAAGYGLLGICVFMAVAGFVLGLTSLNKASKASVAAVRQEVDPGARAAYRAACDATEQSAAGAGLVLTECKLVDPGPKGQPNPQLQGDKATVVLQVKETGGNYFIIEAIVSKEAYQPKAVHVTAQSPKPVDTLP
jgi:hypothetical protein